MSNANQLGRAVFSRHRVGSVTHLRISGAIDETFSSQAAAADLVGHVVIDLGRLERISSFGVRKWIEFVGKLPAGAMGLYVIHAPPIVVDQLNMVEGFAGIARILSLLAPYRCDTCIEDRVRLVDVHVEHQVLAEGTAPAHQCPVCQGPLQFADIPSEFFDFVRTQPLQDGIDPVVRRYIESLQPNVPPDQGSVSKIIEGDVTFFRMSGQIGADVNVRRLSAGLEGRVAYDFGGVREVEPKAELRLLQVLEAATASAKVFLWRVPPQVLSVLVKAKKLPAAILTTLSIPAECRNCGGKYYEKLEATEYIQLLATGEAMELQCQICGGLAKLAHLHEIAPVLSRMALGPAPAEVEQLEQRAFSQYLSTANPEVTPSRGKTGETPNSNNKLQILKRLGRGGMAEVFLARQQGVKGFEKYVVLKKILGQFAQSQDFVEMLFAEARANARLTHPNIVQTFDVGMMEGFAYITMEYVRGPDVKKALVELRKKRIKLPVAHALRIVAETAAGLHYAHSYVDPTGKPHPMVHRDVSPHNVLLSLDGAIKLSDFGIAKVQGESDQTQAGVLKGKIAYVSPEAVSGMPLDARNDVFGLGVVLFELLTGQLPFKRENDAATLRAIVREPAANPSQIDASIPTDVGNIVLWALEKDPARRIQSAAQLREALEQSMGRHGMSSSPSAVAEFFKQNLAVELSEYGPIQATDSAPVVIPSPSGSNPDTSSFSVVEVPDAPSPPPAAAPPRPAAPARPAPQAPQAPPRQMAPPPVGTSPGGARGGGSLPSASTLDMLDGLLGPVVVPEDQATGAVVMTAKEPPTITSVPITSPPAAPGTPAGGRPHPAAPHSPQRPSPQSSPPPRPPPQAGNPAAFSSPAARANGALAAAAPARPVPQPAPPKPAAAPQLAAVPDPVERPAKGGARRWVIAASAALVLAAGAIAGTFYFGKQDDGRVAVWNLGADENLYVGGVRVDPNELRLEGDSEIVSVGRQGRLLRFGTATPNEGVDARALVDIDPSASEGRQASLMVDSEPRGCAVRVGGDMQPTLTPLRHTMPAGVELEVVISCGSNAWTRHVAGIPGQSIDLKVQASKR